MVARFADADPKLEPENYQFATYESPVGKLTLACDADGANLVGLWGPNHRDLAAEIPTRVGDRGFEELPALAGAKIWLQQYFAGEKLPLTRLSLAPQGTRFQLAVWELLQEIPHGQTTTYGVLARQVASIVGRQRMSSQAVGGAVGRNPISIIIPCHRVIGADGSLTGYGGGLPMKGYLLGLEGALPHTRERELR